MARIFLSIATSDIDFARYVERRLSRRGHNVFLADHNIRVGADWRETLQYELKQADWVIALVTPDALSLNPPDVRVTANGANIPPNAQAYDVSTHLIEHATGERLDVRLECTEEPLREWPRYEWYIAHYSNKLLPVALADGANPNHEVAVRIGDTIRIVMAQQFTRGVPAPVLDLNFSSPRRWRTILASTKREKSARSSPWWKRLWPSLEEGRVRFLDSWFPERQVRKIYSEIEDPAPPKPSRLGWLAPVAAAASLVGVIWIGFAAEVPIPYSVDHQARRIAADATEAAKKADQRANDAEASARRAITDAGEARKAACAAAEELATSREHTIRTLMALAPAGADLGTGLDPCEADDGALLRAFLPLRGVSEETYTVTDDDRQGLTGIVRRNYPEFAESPTAMVNVIVAMNRRFCTREGGRDMIFRGEGIQIPKLASPQSTTADECRSFPD